ncbi:MAG: hypothetical protein VB859_14495, partial [Planctomycetaceae bacterium]
GAAGSADVADAAPATAESAQTASVDHGMDGKSIQAVIDAVGRAGGGTVQFAAGVYRLQAPLVVGDDFVRLVGASRGTILKATRRDQVLVRFGGSHGGVEHMAFDGSLDGRFSGMIAGHANPPDPPTGVIGLQVAPVVAGNVPPEKWGRRVHVNYNRFCNLVLAGCSEGITLQAGPSIPRAGDSGCWYNVFDTVLITYTVRGIWLRDPMLGRGSSVNRNQFYSVRVGQWANTGVQVDAGDTNSFFGCSFEGIGHGGAPSRKPTAIVIHKASSTGADNNHNLFSAARFEGCAIDLDNRNGYTEFYGSNLGYGFGKVVGGRPLVVLGGSDSSVTTNYLPGMTITATGIEFDRPVDFRKGASGAK